MPEGLENQGTGVAGTDDNEASLKERVPEDVYSYIQTLRSESAERRKALDEVTERFGGNDDLSQAAALWEATRSVEGLQRIQEEVVAALTEVGVTPKQAEAVATEEVTKLAKGKTSVEDIDQLVADKVGEPIQQLRQELAEKEFTEAVQSALTALNLDDPQDRLDVLSYGNAHMTDNVNAANVGDVIKKGYADWKSRLDQFGELAISKYLQEKSADGTAAPVVLTGSTPIVGTDAPKPKNMKESIAAARERIKKSLEVGP